MSKSDKLFLFDNHLDFAQKTFLFSVSLSLGLGKWGAWIGLPKMGIFVIDVLFFCSLLFFKISGQSSRQRSLIFTLLVSSFILFQFLRSDDFSIVLRIRDLLPFIYILFIPLITNLLKSINIYNLISCMRAGVLICLGWTIPVMLGIIHPVQAPKAFFGVPIFTNRYDLTGIVLAIGIIVFMEYKQFNLASSQTIISVCLIVGILQSSRAASIAVLLAFAYQTQNLIWYHKFKYFVFVLVFSIFSFFVLSVYPGTVSPILSSSSLARFGFLSESSEASVGARSTYLARVRATDKMLVWFRDQHQNILGVGPGTEMVQESGALADLSGSPEVRAPHNWFIGLWVRYGITGTFIWCLGVFGNFIRTKIRVAIEWKILILIICMVSAMGVIIESPFGSLPLSVIVAMTYVNRKKDEYK